MRKRTSLHDALLAAVGLAAAALGAAPPAAADPDPAARSPETLARHLLSASPLAKAPPGAGKLCLGDYADGVPPDVASRIAEGMRDSFVFAIRNTATYEHVFYGRDGKLRRAYLRSVIHGTGFAYRRQGADTLLVTNEHVAAQPEVTDDDRRVDGIPRGSKKVREQLRIVHNEDDDYEPGHIALAKVLVDPAADIAVLKTKKALPLLPYRLGRSAALKAGNLVQVRGFPLGVFPALSSGKVTNAGTADAEHGWSHEDFMIDALLSGGNSGSPVFAISCSTGEPELVGVYHAGFSDAAALNAVVAIDQLRDELETLRPPRRERAGKNEISAADIDEVVRELAKDPAHSLVFPFGARAVRVQLEPKGALRFGVLDEDFPLVNRETLSLLDRGRAGEGALVAVAVVDPQPAEVPLADYAPDVREHFEKLHDALWHQLLGVTDYRRRLVRSLTNADAFAEARSLRARLRKRAAEQKELLNVCAFEVDRASIVTQRPVASAAPGQPDAAAQPGQDTTAGEPEESPAVAEPAAQQSAQALPLGHPDAVHPPPRVAGEVPQ